MLLLFVSIPLIGGLLSSISLRGEWKQWYDKLDKPSWTPPAWLFGPAWTVLYILMGIASYIVWQNGGGAVPLSMYFIQLAVNLTWSPVFFGLRRPDIALAIILMLWGMILSTIVLFTRVSGTAALLLVPYIAWVSYASSLNAYIVMKN